MTTQAQGKGKKKNKEVMKVSLEEFNQIDAPHGHSVVSLKMTGLDWAETMAADQQSTEVQQIIVPAAPRAQRGPGVDFDSLPNEPPFRVSIFNLPMSFEEKDVKERFFQGLDVVKVEISKSSTTVELGSKDALYEALCKDGHTHKGRTLNVCLYGQSPQNQYGSDRFGGRGGNSSYGDRYGDRDRNQGGFGGQRTGDRFGDRAGYSGSSRSGFGQQRSGYGDRFYDRNDFGDNNRGQFTSGGGGGENPSEESTNWRARPTVKSPPVSSTPPSYNNGSRQPYTHSRFEQSSQPRYQQQHHNQPPNNSPYPQLDNLRGSDAAPTEERPKLVLSKRKTPLNQDDVSSVSRNEAIFGKAKPSSTPYEKMKEVEEKLKAVL